MARRRTVMRSSKGKKLYAVRDKKGKFKDIQILQARDGRGHQAQSQGRKAEEEAEEKVTTETPQFRFGPAGQSPQGRTHF